MTSNKPPRNIEDQPGMLEFSQNRVRRLATRLKHRNGKVLAESTKQKYAYVEVSTTRKDLPGRSVSAFHNPAEAIAQAIADSMNPDKQDALTVSPVRILKVDTIESPTIKKHYPGYYGSQPEVWDALHRANFRKHGEWGRKTFVSLYKSMVKGRVLSDSQVKMIFNVLNGTKGSWQDITKEAET